MKMPRPQIVILSQKGSLMGTHAQIAARMLGRDIVVTEELDQLRYSLNRLMHQYQNASLFVGYPHVEDAHVLTPRLHGDALLTRGANVLVSRDGMHHGYDTRAQGLLSTMQFLGLPSFRRALVIGRASPANAAALACRNFGVPTIDILNPGAIGNQDQGWRGVAEISNDPGYDLVINTMRDSGIAPKMLHPHLRPGMTVVDLVYWPDPATVLLETAAVMGAKTVNGILPVAFRTKAALAHATGAEDDIPFADFAQAVQSVAA